MTGGTAAWLGTPGTAWVWDAAGQARAGAGISDSPARARETAEQFMTQAGALTARVEKVIVVIGRTTLADSYTTTGQGWTAARAGHLITWTPLRPILAAS
jgi:hypothetical protein